VCGFKRAADLSNHGHGFAGRECSLLPNDVLQADSFDKVHRDERRALILADIENADDILVRDLLRKKHFLFEALHHQRGCRQFRVNSLQRDDACQPSIEDFVDRTHAANTERVNDFVAIGKYVARQRNTLFVGRARGWARGGSLRRRSSSPLQGRGRHHCLRGSGSALRTDFSPRRVVVPALGTANHCSFRVVHDAETQKPESQMVD
jgi:hypothetical protein